MELKLGKLPAKVDKRTIKLSSIIRKKLLPDLPVSYNVDESLGGIDDDRMFANDRYGNCVIAARAHQTFRFEKFEQKKQIPITDQEVIDQYKEETGGGPGWEQRGLYILNSLKTWRKDGWKVGGKGYTIYAFASVNWKNHDEVKHCIHLLGGVNFGMLVYQSDMEQFKLGKDWELGPSSGSFLGGHGVYLYAYQYKHNDCPHCVFGWNEDGLLCMTWGKRQKMSWEFWDARVDEAYGIVDDRNKWMGNSPVDVKELDKQLKEITGESQKEIPCPIARAAVKGTKILLKGLGW